MTATFDDAYAVLGELEKQSQADQATIADLKRQLAECLAAPVPPQPLPRSVFGFAGPDPTGKAKVLRVYLNPGDSFPKPAPGILHFITYKGPQDHALRAKQAAAYQAPCLLGFHHEPEGPGGADYTPQVYKAHWNTLGAELIKAKAFNVRPTWVMMAASFTGSPTDHANAYYPGDDLIEVVGADGYDWCGCKTSGTGYFVPGSATRSFAKVFKGLLDFAQAHGKDAAVGEFGTPQRKDGDETYRTTWIEDAIATAKVNTRIIAACYFQHSAGFACHWELKGASLDAYAKAL